MKYIICSLITMFCLVNVHSQENPIKITSDRNENIVTIYAENTSDEIYNVELNITSTGFKHTRECPINESIQPGMKVKMTSLIAKKNEEASYSISLKYSPSHKEGKQQIAGREASDIDVTKGIFVFSKEGCGRCKHVESFLDKNEVNYTKLNITKNTGDATLMWQKIAETGYTGSSVQTPVIIIDGTVHFNKPNFNALLKSLVH